MADQESQNFYYNFGDGWGANIEVKVTDAKTKAKILRRNAGFYGYEWMVNSIILHGEIWNSLGKTHG